MYIYGGTLKGMTIRFAQTSRRRASAPLRQKLAFIKCKWIWITTQHVAAAAAVEEEVGEGAVAHVVVDEEAVGALVAEAEEAHQVAVARPPDGAHLPLELTLAVLHQLLQPLHGDGPLSAAPQRPLEHRAERAAAEVVSEAVRRVLQLLVAVRAERRLLVQGLGVGERDAPSHHPLVQPEQPRRREEGAQRDERLEPVADQRDGARSPEAVVVVVAAAAAAARRARRSTGLDEHRVAAARAAVSKWELLLRARAVVGVEQRGDAEAVWHARRLAVGGARARGQHPARRVRPRHVLHGRHGRTRVGSLPRRALAGAGARRAPARGVAGVDQIEPRRAQAAGLRVAIKHAVAVEPAGALDMAPIARPDPLDVGLPPAARQQSMAIRTQDAVGIKRDAVVVSLLYGLSCTGLRQVLGVAAIVADEVEHAAGIEAQGDGEAYLERAGVPVRGGGDVHGARRVHDEVAVVELVGQPVLAGGPARGGDAREELCAGGEVLAGEQGVGRRRERRPRHRRVRGVQHEVAVVAHGRRDGRLGRRGDGPVLAVRAGPEQAAVVGEPQRAAGGRRVVAARRPRHRYAGRGGEPDAHGEAAVGGIEAEDKVARRRGPAGAGDGLHGGARSDICLGKWHADEGNNHDRYQQQRQIYWFGHGQEQANQSTD